MRIPITVVVDVDPRAYRAEYGMDKAPVGEGSPEAIREYVTDMVVEAARTGLYPFTGSHGYVRSVDLRGGAQ